jgi:hypothetical protein
MPLRVGLSSGLGHAWVATNVNPRPEAEEAASGARGRLFVLSGAKCVPARLILQKKPAASSRNKPEGRRLLDKRREPAKRTELDDRQQAAANSHLLNAATTRNVPAESKLQPERGCAVCNRSLTNAACSMGNTLSASPERVPSAVPVFVCREQNERIVGVA